jgi:hypothetical protein
MWSAAQLQQIVAELERLGVPAYGGGRVRTVDSARLPGGEVLRRLRALPDRAGAAAVRDALLAEPGVGGSGAGGAATYRGAAADGAGGIRLRAWTRWTAVGIFSPASPRPRS